MAHPNATLTPRHQLKVARLVVDDGHPIAEVAARFQCSWPTVKRWADRYRASEAVTAFIAARGSDSRYLIHHSAGSGKSMTISWLAHRLGVPGQDVASGEPG